MTKPSLAGAVRRVLDLKQYVAIGLLAPGLALSVACADLSGFWDHADEARAVTAEAARLVAVSDDMKRTLGFMAAVAADETNPMSASQSAKIMSEMAHEARARAASLLLNQPTVTYRPASGLGEHVRLFLAEGSLIEAEDEGGDLDRTLDRIERLGLMEPGDSSPEAIESADINLEDGVAELLSDRTASLLHLKAVAQTGDAVRLRAEIAAAGTGAMNPVRRIAFAAAAQARLSSDRDMALTMDRVVATLRKLAVIDAALAGISSDVRAADFKYYQAAGAYDLAQAKLNPPVATSVAEDGDEPPHARVQAVRKPKHVAPLKLKPPVEVDLVKLVGGRLEAADAMISALEGHVVASASLGW